MSDGRPTLIDMSWQLLPQPIAEMIAATNCGALPSHRNVVAI